MEKESSCKTKIKKWVKFASLGKYRTPLYYKGNDEYSSIVTATFSLIFVLVMIGTAIVIFLPIFRKDDYYLVQKTIPLDSDLKILISYPEYDYVPNPSCGDKC